MTTPVALTMRQAQMIHGGTGEAHIRLVGDAAV
jgi:hypothetical protein